MKWVDTDLGDIATFMSGGTPSKQKDEYWGGDIAWVSAKDLKGQRIYDSGLHITEAGAANGTRLVPENTILFVVRGMSLESEFRISLTKIPVTFNQDLKALCPSENIDPVFLFYSLYTRRDHIRQLASEASHGTKKLPTEVIKSIKLQIPDISTQKKVASIASAYDDLIENNRRRIQLLERSLHLLYKEWFVHLRFPSHEHSKIVDGIPEGWERKPFSHLADFINGFAFKPEHLGDQGLPIVKIPELRDGITSKTPRNIGDIVPDKNYLYTGDILFSWSGTILVNIWNHGEALLNQHLFKVVPKTKELYGFVYIALQYSLILFANETTGATMKHFRRSALDKVSVAVPNTTLLEQFDDTVSPVLSQISNLQRQTTKLQQARDLLLPKLMSGAISV